MKDAVLIHLVCGHEVWMTRPTPNVGDVLLCVRCDQYRRADIGDVQHRVTTFPTWKSTPIGRRNWRGECGACPETRTNRNWFTLRDHMESHASRAHYTEVPEFKVIKRPA